MAEQGYNLTLLTFDTGALRNLDTVSARYALLSEKYPNNVKRHQILEDVDSFRTLALLDIESDFRNYKHNLICLGCKLSMHANAIVYAKQNNVSIVADGSSLRQSMWPEQSNESVEFMKNLYKEYEIEYINPVYDFKSKSEVQSKLKQFDLPEVSSEARCLFEHTFTSPDTKEYKELTMRYLKDKTEKTLEFINRELDG